jgi:hypothetical protein
MVYSVTAIQACLVGFSSEIDMVSIGWAWISYGGINPLCCGNLFESCHLTTVSIKEKSKLLTTDGRSVSMSWSPLWDLWPDITSCRNFVVWNLRSCFRGAPSLTRGRSCNLQCFFYIPVYFAICSNTFSRMLWWGSKNHSMVRVAQNP